MSAPYEERLMVPSLRLVLVTPLADTGIIMCVDYEGMEDAYEGFELAKGYRHLLSAELSIPAFDGNPLILMSHYVQ